MKKDKSLHIDEFDTNIHLVLLCVDIEKAIKVINSQKGDTVSFIKDLREFIQKKVDNHQKK